MSHQSMFVQNSDYVAARICKQNLESSVARKSNAIVDGWPYAANNLGTSYAPPEVGSHNGNASHDLSNNFPASRQQFTRHGIGEQAASGVDVMYGVQGLYRFSTYPTLDRRPMMPSMLTTQVLHGDWDCEWEVPNGVPRPSHGFGGVPVRFRVRASFTDSKTSNPKSSFDTLRHPPTQAAQQARLPQRQQIPPYLSATTRPRSSSTMSAPHTASTAFVNVLHGPGGVGALRALRTEKTRPGPAEDALNKKFAQYIPDLLPPQSDARFLSANRHHRTNSSSLRVTPRASSESVISTRSNSSSVPTAIDGWLKRMTSSGAPGVVAKIGRAGRHTTNQLGGDLIELDDTVSSVRGKDTDDPNDISEGTAAKTTRVGDGLAGSSKSDEDLMNEPFPIRGRVTRAYKSD